MSQLKQSPLLGPTTLENGDSLSQPEFHRRYQGYPEDRKIELVGGIVYMASPVRRPHGTFSVLLILLLGQYWMKTPGTEVADNMTAILGEDSEPQPDVLLRLTAECGGQSSYNEEQYLVGAPEMVVEIAHSSRALDMNQKKHDYFKAGVQEYLVLCIEEHELHWFHFPSRRKLKADKNGVFKSKVFPGLWVDSAALLAKDSSKLLATVNLGLETKAHTDFVALLQSRASR
jgi:Uma2 family endonuclease